MLIVKKRKGSPYYQISGTHCGVRVRQTTGTADFQTSKKIRSKLERDIEDKQYSDKTFADALEAYIENGGEDKYLNRINEVLGKLPLKEIGQQTIDEGARKAYGSYTRRENGNSYKHKTSTIKRQWYDPVAAVLHYAADMEWIPYKRVKKPKTELSPPEWVDPEYFDKLWKHCDKELKALTMFLCLTGCRIQECLDLEWKNVDLKHKKAFIPKTKTKTYRTVNLPPLLVASLKAVKSQGFVFSMTYDDVRRKLKQACRHSELPYMSSHKIGSHTYATWMRRYAGADARDLMDTGRWKSQQMAERYTHTDISESAKKSDVLAGLFK